MGFVLSQILWDRKVDLPEGSHRRTAEACRSQFKEKISNIDDYCATLRVYLLSDNGECHLKHTFTKAKVDIVELMDVP